MLFAIVDRTSLEVYETYEAEAKDDTSTNRSWLRAEPKCIHIEVTEGLTADCLKCELVEGVYTLSDDATKVAAKAAADKAARITALYDAMNADIFAQMNTVFGTTRSDSSLRQGETWQRMIAAPASYVNQKADKTVGAFTAGDVLATEQNVTDFATARLAEADTYLVWSYERIETFRAARQAILDE